MIALIIKYLPWGLSCITIYMNILAGNKKPHAWVVGLVGQVFWSIWIVISENYGFVPLNIALWYVYFQNHRKWNKDLS